MPQPTALLLPSPETVKAPVPPVPLLTVVLPCLDEEKSLACCLPELHKAFREWMPGTCEILVVDNGSVDQSARVAEEGGARVLREPERGYGSAIRSGIAAARSEWVVMVDADGTYPYELAEELFRRTREAGADLGLASRLTGKVEQGAMPFLHRRAGTPFFTILINLLFEGRLTDCGTGMRCLRRSWFLNHPHHARGMEFASENLIRALKSGARIVEISGGLRAGDPRRRPHLRTWRDGMRHLLFILAECPRLFERAGLWAAGTGALLQGAAAAHGPLRLGIVDIFGLHTQVLAMLTGLLGAQWYILGLFLFERSPENPGRVTWMLLRLPEDRLFFALLSALLGGGVVSAAVAVQWWQSHFSGISVERGLLAAAHGILLLGLTSLGLLAVHMMRTRFPFTRPHPVRQAAEPYLSHD